jgi:SAM-dependent methyltransferase
MFSNNGFCYACNQKTTFVAQNDWWRDSYICSKCGSIPRERALMYCVVNCYPKWNEFVIHESSPCERGPSIRFRKEAKRYIPSQYYEGRKPGEIIDGYRNEDLENLTFLDNSIDLHITQDVFEHLLDPAKAFREIGRTLKPGGAHIFTTPLVNKLMPSQQCIKRGRNHALIQLLEPREYHSNPISLEGSPVTMHWGYDITEFIKSACGLSTEIILVDLLDYGIRAELNEVLITRKPR